MLTNYLKTSIRILLRQKAHSVINITGLTFGLASSLLIILYILDDLSFDRFHTDPERIYRAAMKGHREGNDFGLAKTPPLLAEALVNEVPQVESSVRFAYWPSFPIRIDTRVFTEKQLLLADSNFFEFFNFRLIQGDPKNALRGPHQVVLTEEAAKKYFAYKGPGDSSPIGKVLIMGGAGEHTGQVSGIMANPPPNSHFHFNMILSLDSWNMKNYGWTANCLYTYFKVLPAADLNAMQVKLNYFVEKYLGVEIEKQGSSLKQLSDQGYNEGFFAQPLLDIHLQSHLDEELEPNSSITYLYLFGAISLFIIIIACINFMNLSTARSTNRAKEVGVRKTFGALVRVLMKQFLIESYIYVFIAVLLALLVIYAVMTPFNILVGKDLQFSMLAKPAVLSGILLFTVLVGLLAGSYPAFYLSSFKPVDVLRGKLRSGMKSSGIRNFMVITQFTIAIGLIICTGVVYRQLNFVNEKDLGFERENILNVSHAWILGENGIAFKNELLKHPEFISVSYANQLPPNFMWATGGFRMKGMQQDISLNIYEMDYDHLKTLGYTLTRGRFFSRDFPSDSSAIIINEEAAAQMGITEIEGQRIVSPGNSEHPDSRLIGIMKNFNYESLHSTIKPMAIHLGMEPNAQMAIRITPGNVLEKIGRVEEIWKKLAPQAPFEYSFVDEDFNAYFQAEQRMGRVILVFTFLSIGIACLGLFGLAAFAAEQRSKEISIRKVLGATVYQVVFLLSKDFSRLVLTAFIIAIPLSVYWMNQWLEGFVYRIDIGIAVVMLAGVLALFVALFTISIESIKAALRNPVDSLRME